MSNQVKTALVVMADGSEELETVAVVDILRRAGTKVTVASASGQREVTCSRCVRIIADELIDEIERDGHDFDLVVCPGGMPGAKNLSECIALQKLLLRHADQGRESIIAAICAAPAIVLEPLGIMKGKSGTCFPSFAEKLLSTKDGCSEERVVVDSSNRVVTSRAPGTAIEFALKLVELLHGPEILKQVAGPMLVTNYL